MALKKIKVYGHVDDSIVDGPGLRYTLFTQGCPHHCEGCHNPKSHDINGGKWTNIDEIVSSIKSNPLLDGITLSGGEPFMQADALIELLNLIPSHLHIMIYSGYTFEEIMDLGESERTLLKMCDTLVDGKFILNQRSLTLLYKGSTNQRIINIKQSLIQNQIILEKINDYGEFITE